MSKFLQIKTYNLVKPNYFLPKTEKLQFYVEILVMQSFFVGITIFLLLGFFAN